MELDAFDTKHPVLRRNNETAETIRRSMQSRDEVGKDDKNLVVSIFFRTFAPEMISSGVNISEKCKKAKAERW